MRRVVVAILRGWRSDGESTSQEVRQSGGADAVEVIYAALGDASKKAPRSTHYESCAPTPLEWIRA